MADGMVPGRFRLVVTEGASPRMRLRTDCDREIVFEDYLSTHTTDLPDYDGPTVVVPSESAQTLSTELTALMSDIVVQPIPSNWGRIVYDGSIITVV